MEVAVELSDGLVRHLKIQLPADRVDAEVLQRLQKVTKTASLKGFRKGKVPLKVIKQQFGRSIRGEVVGELINTSFREAVKNNNYRIVGQPQISDLKDVEGAQLEYRAVFEVYPEVVLADFSKIKIRRSSAEIEDSDIDEMISNLQAQKASFELVDRTSKDGDQLVIDYIGVKDGVEFAGGKATDQKLVLGSKSMIPGFEDGLKGAGANEEIILKLTFPEDYHSETLAGSPVEFTINVKSVSERKIPELTDEFFQQFGVKSGDIDQFRAEVESNMRRELDAALRSNLKSRIMHQLFQLHPIEIPEAQILGEIKTLKEQTLRQFGGGKEINFDALPDEMFRGKAKYRAALGVIVSEALNAASLSPDPDMVKSRITEIAQTYDQPQDVINYYYSKPELLSAIEASTMEEQLMELVLTKAEVEEEVLPYKDAVKPDPEPNYSDPLKSE
jgi:trigger factor